MMKIGILSDTHDLLRPEVIERLRGCEHILHAGDVSSQVVLDQLGQIAPVRAVRGNNDRDWAEHLPPYLDITLGGLRIYMTHRKKDLPSDLSDHDLVICGHSHRYAEAWLPAEGPRRTLLLNPGSCGPRRFHQPVTMAVLTIDKDGWQVERIDIAPAPKGSVPSAGAGDMRSLIEIVIRETQKGQPVSAIAQRHGLEAALVEQIARLYVTHPGVTADGIMTKMGL